MPQRPLTIVTRAQGNNRALRDGTITPATAELEFVDVPVIVHAFRRMVRTLEFDICEMALTTYLCAREHGVRFTALPIFLVRGFHHGAIARQAGSGIDEPKQLQGTRVGVNRGYTVTTGVWARGILAAEYGVDLDSVTWVLSGDEHVAAYRPPANVEPMPDGSSLPELLAGGELSATIGVGADAPGTTTLIPDAEQAGYDALRERDHYPINHLVVVRDDVLAERPELAVELFDAFAESKRRYIEQLRIAAIAQPTAIDRMHEQVMHITRADPLPYGIEPNRHVLAELVQHALDQHILDRAPDLDELFAESTRALVG
jgi:4,5-dihydroxyphthalate decarboxylase